MNLVPVRFSHFHSHDFVHSFNVIKPFCVSPHVCIMYGFVLIYVQICLLVSLSSPLLFSHGRLTYTHTLMDTKERVAVNC